jgi:type II secretion system protein I
MRLHSPARRDGITLLEVLASTAIFLISLIALMDLMKTASNQADEIRQRSRATRLCQSKMNEFVAGVETLGSSSSGTFDEDPNWQWTADSSTDANTSLLYKVTVTVTRDIPSTGKVEISMSQMVLDPQQRGHLADTSASTAEAASSSSSSSSSSSNSSSSQSGTNTTGNSSTGGSTTGTGSTGGGATGGTGGGTGGGRGGTTGGGGTGGGTGGGRGGTGGTGGGTGGGRGGR